MSILYLLAFLDRTNIANASVFGLVADLKLGGNEYNTALTIFFVPYILFEIPSNIILKKLKPSVWLPSCMFMFGVVTICQGFVQGYGGLLATRFFLGLFEAGMFPGSFYLISSWYKRHEAQKRYTFFFASTTLAGAFGGLLASAIGKMNGIRGYLGWRWIVSYPFPSYHPLVASCFLHRDGFCASDLQERQKIGGSIDLIVAEDKFGNILLSVGNFACQVASQSPCYLTAFF